MRINLALAALILAFAAPRAHALDMGDALLKAWEKKDAIVKTTKALRKGFQELSDEEEYYIGRAVAARILTDYKTVADPARTEYLNTVGQTLALYSTRPATFAGYHFRIIASAEVNAFAAPGGFIFVTTGLLAQVKSEDQLAAVLAHEIAHVTLKHGLGAIKSANLTQAFTILGTEAVKEYSSADLSALTTAFEGVINDVVNQLVVNGYSRTQEYDADQEAVRIAYKAGYNPSGLAEFLGSLAALTSGDSKGLGFYKTHPPANERKGKVESLIAKKKLEGAPSQARDARFQARFM